jgi:superfamily II RNA helicase
VDFNLDKFQVEAIDSINKDFNVLVIAPTVSGKTFIAEKAI